MSATAPVKRGTTNGNRRGSSYTRRRRREWLVETYRADVDLIRVVNDVPPPDPLYAAEGVFYVENTWRGAVDLFRSMYAEAELVPTCRCYRCGCLLTVETVTVDRIIPGCRGGTYRRDNIRPACGPCNSETGGATRRKR